MNAPALQTIKFNSALLESATGETEWKDNVLITVNEGLIVDVTPDSDEFGALTIDGVAIPAIVNVHSHAFQRGFAGLSEYRTAKNDSFWTWRKLMYDFVGKLSPEDVFIIARQLYLEMIDAGYSWVGEFHYLHNDVAGSRFENRAEMADSVLRAANETGIGICLIPVLYQRRGFDSDQVDAGQRRFALTNDEYFSLVELCRSRTANEPNASLAMAIHSLRAVGQDSMTAALKFRSEVQPGCPVHIHIAEQTQEVDDCVAATGNRSIEYLLSRFEVDEHWCLIHATHMDQSETKSLAATGATVGLCPTTEANLGDGVFPANDFLNRKGSIAIGSDSHCSVDMREELRTLEYGQRLTTRKRAVLGTDSQSVGRRLFSACTRGGAQAIGVSTGRIAPGCRADLLVINDQHATIAGAEGDRLLDRMIFSNTGNPIHQRMIGGTWIDSDSLQSSLAESSREFVKLNKRLLS